MLYVASRLCIDIDEVEGWPSTKLLEWVAFFSIESKLRGGEESPELKEKKAAISLQDWAVRHNAKHGKR